MTAVCAAVSTLLVVAAASRGVPGQTFPSGAPVNAVLNAPFTPFNADFSLNVKGTSCSANLKQRPWCHAV